jgi:hypothetical protein
MDCIHRSYIKYSYFNPRQSNSFLLKITVLWDIIRRLFGICYRLFVGKAFCFRDICWENSVIKLFVNVLGTFAKLRNETIRFVMFVRLSVRMEQLGFYWTDFYELLYWKVFRKSVEKIQVSLKSDKNNGNLIWGGIFFIISLSFLFKMRNVSDRKYQNTHFVSSYIFSESVSFMSYV